MTRRSRKHWMIIRINAVLRMLQDFINLMIDDVCYTEIQTN